MPTCSPRVSLSLGLTKGKVQGNSKGVWPLLPAPPLLQKTGASCCPPAPNRISLERVLYCFLGLLYLSTTNCLHPRGSRLPSSWDPTPPSNHGSCSRLLPPEPAPFGATVCSQGGGGRGDTLFRTLSTRAPPASLLAARVQQAGPPSRPFWPRPGFCIIGPSSSLGGSPRPG